MKKGNKSLTKFTAFVLLLTMITLVIISGTLAKYVEQYAGSGTAIVAKWAVTMKDIDGNGISDTTKFNLFDVSKVYDLNEITAETNLSQVTGVKEADVAEGTDKAIVAPGTWGKVGFKIAIDGTNEVKVKYGIDITTLTNNITPLEFSVDGENWKTADEIKTLTTKVVEPNTAVPEETVTLYWRWLYENSADKADTTLGSADEAATCEIQATFGAVQVD